MKITSILLFFLTANVFSNSLTIIKEADLNLDVVNKTTPIGDKSKKNNSTTKQSTLNSASIECVTNTKNVFRSSDDIASFVMIAKEQIELKDNNLVISGALGVTQSNGTAKIKDESIVYSFVKSPEIEIDSDSSVGASIYAQAVITLPSFITNNTTNGDSVDIVVEEGEDVVLPGDVYGKIEVKEGATLSFTSSDVFIKEIKTKENATIIFINKCGNVYLQKGMELGENNIFNPMHRNVTIYADDKVKIKKGTNLTARIYVRDKEIEVKGERGNTTYMNGIFVAKKIKGDDHVTWTQDLVTLPCDPVTPPEGACNECDGGLVELTMQYNGMSNATIMVLNKDDEVLYQGMHSATDQFTFIGNGDENRMTNTIYFFVNGLEVSDLHVSCSQPVGPGLQIGDFEIISGVSRNGGALCPYVEECECKGGLTEITIAYSGGPGAILISNSGTVTDNGDGTYTITNNGDKLEKNLEVSNGVETAEIHTSCSQDILGVTFSGGIQVVHYTDTEGHSSDLVEGCSSVEVPGECECKGGLEQLIVSYSGGPGATLVSNSGTVIDNGDGTYTIYDNGDKLEKNLELSNGSDTAEIHTSCSQDILGVTFEGGIVVVGYTDMEGSVVGVNGEFCNPAPEKSQVKLNSVSNSLQVQVSPNPSQNTFRIKMDNAVPNKNYKLQLLDISGKLLLSEEHNPNEEFSFGSDLKTGMYFLNIIQGDQKQTIKLLKK
ncbi:T9SS type A sorting domain-containing protein [Lacinutrix gracilariae]|uniref:T9SS type A sorting domain-containing protein n=1 Tax=Lacinutrix gracilariae TaxID=1747198 RepID=A0ABW5K2B8_9FLAO